MAELDADGFEALYRRHAAEVFGYLARRIGAEDATDLVAETFLTAWRRRSQLPNPHARRAWLFGTARRLLLAHYRQPRSEALPEPDLLAARRLAAAAAGRGEADPDAVVLAVLAELPEPDRELLTMTAWEGLSVAEAGAALGLRPGAARVRLLRLRRRLAADPRIAPLLAPAHDEDDPVAHPDSLPSPREPTRSPTERALAPRESMPTPRVLTPRDPVPARPR